MSPQDALVADRIADQHEADTAYGKGYLGWKGWNEGNFAKVDVVETSYFDAELRKAISLDSGTGMKVLEIGFGNASFLAYARNRGWEAIGTEVNGLLIEMATQRGLRAIHADRMGTLQSNSFDLIVAFDVLEHIPPTSLLGFVQELIYLLKPGGIFMARFPNADSPFGLINQNGDATHLNAIGLGKVRYLARELDMRIVSFGGQATPWLRNDFMRSLRRVCRGVFFRMTDALVNAIFFPNDPITFCASNVVLILETKNTFSSPRIDEA